ncbi:hypothetical protein Syun_019361 [Stephania yunnanensis]|uniref:Uncharacterized protein n=1 Tax=Stephania yunnanensis TaxID=152371 RepID=A0AAP0IU43_9MAGN
MHARCGAEKENWLLPSPYFGDSELQLSLNDWTKRNNNNSLHGQVTIGTLIFQDCAVGILFALLLVLGGNSGIRQGIISTGKLSIDRLDRPAAELANRSQCTRFVIHLMCFRSRFDRLGFVRRLHSVVDLVVSSSSQRRLVVSSSHRLHSVVSSSTPPFRSLFHLFRSKFDEQRAREIYFKEWDPHRQTAPDSSNVDRLRDFIKHVYEDRRYTGDRIMDKLTRGTMQVAMPKAVLGTRNRHREYVRLAYM